MVAFLPEVPERDHGGEPGAALLLTSEAAARRLGIAPDRWVYPWAGVDVTEAWFLTERATLHELPGTRRAAAALFDAVGFGAGAIAHLELYSCFPIAPRLSAATLGLDPATDRALTVAGGLPWFGGPGNDYGTHALAALVGPLRRDHRRSAQPMASAELPKHALAVWAAPPRPQRRRRTTSAWVDAQPGRPSSTATGAATIETYTVVHGRDGGPERGVVMARMPGDRRTMAALPADRDVLESLERAEGVGRAGTLRHVDGRNVFDPR
jgi:acetyl-CoA C-acetyltransferase